MTAARPLPTGDERDARWRAISLTRPGYATWPDTAPGTPSWWARHPAVPPPSPSWARSVDRPRPVGQIAADPPLPPITGPTPGEAVAPYAGDAMSIVWRDKRRFLRRWWRFLTTTTRR